MDWIYLNFTQDNILSSKTIDVKKETNQYKLNILSLQPGSTATLVLSNGGTSFRAENGHQIDNSAKKSEGKQLIVDYNVQNEIVNSKLH